MLAFLLRSDKRLLLIMQFAVIPIARDFKYQKGFAVKYQLYCFFAFVDDKHRCKVGERSNSMAAVAVESK